MKYQIFLMTRIVVARFTSCEPVNLNLETPGKRRLCPGSMSRDDVPLIKRSLLPHHAVRWLLSYKLSDMNSWIIKYLNLNSLDFTKFLQTFEAKVFADFGDNYSTNWVLSWFFGRYFTVIIACYQAYQYYCIGYTV